MKAQARKKMLIIIKAVLAETAVSKDELFSLSRRREVVDARHLILKYCMDYVYIRGKITMQYIGSLMGREHSALLHAVKKIGQMNETDRYFRKMHDDLNSKIYMKLKCKTGRNIIQTLIHSIKNFIKKSRERKKKEYWYDKL